MVSVFASVNLPLHHKVQKFSSDTVSPGWSRKNGRKMVVVWWCWWPNYCTSTAIVDSSPSDDQGQAVAFDRALTNEYRRVGKRIRMFYFIFELCLTFLIEMLTFTVPTDVSWFYSVNQSAGGTWFVMSLVDCKMSVSSRCLLIFANKHFVACGWVKLTDTFASGLLLFQY